jgi:hypothetical protein
MNNVIPAVSPRDSHINIGISAADRSAIAAGLSSLSEAP